MNKTENTTPTIDAIPLAELFRLGTDLASASVDHLDNDVLRLDEIRLVVSRKRVIVYGRGRHIESGAVFDLEPHGMYLQAPGKQRRKKVDACPVRE